MATSATESGDLANEEPAVSATGESSSEQSCVVEISVESTISNETSQVSSEVTSSIEEETIQPNTTEYSVPQNQSGFKSWMPYTALSKSSPNYKMLMDYGHVDENGLWMIQDYYCVAMGSYYSQRLGNMFEATLSNGNKIKLITVDHKADIHTDSTHRVTKQSNCMTEFIIDRAKLNANIKSSGSVGSLPQFSGTYVNITKIGNIFDEDQG